MKDRLENWSVAPCDREQYVPPENLSHYHLRGYSASRKKDVVTSRIVAVYGNFVRTASGTEYELGVVDPDYSHFLEEAGMVLGPRGQLEVAGQIGRTGSN